MTMVGVLTHHTGSDDPNGEILGVFLPGEVGAEEAEQRAWRHAQESLRIGITWWRADPRSFGDGATDGLRMRFATPLINGEPGEHYRFTSMAIQAPHG